MIQQDLDKIIDELATNALLMATQLNSDTLSSGVQQQRQQQLSRTLMHIERLTRLFQVKAAQPVVPAHANSAPVVQHNLTAHAIASQPIGDELTRALASARHPLGYTCLCGTPAAILYERRAWRCPSCGRQRAIAAGTMLQDSHLPWSAWFRAIAVLSHYPGITAQELLQLAGLKRLATARRVMLKIATLDVKRPLISPDEISKALLGQCA